MRSLEPRARKRVRESANNKFAGIKEIAKAEEASRKALNRRRRAKSEDRSQQLKEVQDMIIHELDRLHRLEKWIKHFVVYKLPYKWMFCALDVGGGGGLVLI